MKALTNIGIYPAENVPVQKTIKQVFNKVLKMLLKHVNLEAVYCFGFQSHVLTKYNMILEDNCQNHQWQLNLLLIGRNIPPNSTANLSDMVYQQFEGEISLTLLCYSPIQIAHSNNEHQHLFAGIIQSGWLVYGKYHELAELKLANLPGLNYKGIVTYTQNRMNIAESLLKHTPLFFDQPLIAAYMLRNSIEQLCLGTLYAFIHYHPNQFHIQYLLQLCKSCCGLPEIIFPDGLFQQERFKELLKTSVSDLRFRSTNIFNKEEVQLFYQNCVSFKDNVEPIIQKRLSQLKSQACEK